MCEENVHNFYLCECKMFRYDKTQKQSRERIIVGWLLSKATTFSLLLLLLLAKTAGKKLSQSLSASNLSIHTFDLFSITVQNKAKATHIECRSERKKEKLKTKHKMWGFHRIRAFLVGGMCCVEVI